MTEPADAQPTPEKAPEINADDPQPNAAPELEPGPEPGTPKVPSVFRRLDAPLTLVVLALAIGLLAFLQLSTDQLIDHDSLYHVQAAHLLATKGDRIILKRRFPW